MKLKSVVQTFAVVVLGVLAALGQNGQKTDIAMKLQGPYLVPIPGAQVLTCSTLATGTPCSPTATVYSDKALSSPKSNPFTADAQGNYGFYSSSCVMLQITDPASGQSYQQNDVCPAIDASGFISSTDMKLYTLPKNGGVSGSDATTVIKSILGSIAPSSAGTVQLTPGSWPISHTIDTSNAGFVALQGGTEGGAQFQSVVPCTAVDNIVTGLAFTGGSLYTTNPTITFSGGGATSQATAHASVSGGAMLQPTLDLTGLGYTGTPSVSVTGGGGSGATVTPNMGVGPCIGDQTHQSNPSTQTHTTTYNNFALLVPSGAGDGLFLDTVGNTSLSLHHLSVTGTSRTASGAAGAMIHIKNSFTNFLDHILTNGGNYGMWFDEQGGGEQVIYNSQFSQARTANLVVSGVATHFQGDLSVVGAPPGGTCSWGSCIGKAALWAQNGAQLGNYEGYFESGTGSYANHAMAQYDLGATNQDASKIWAADQAYCIDLGYLNTCQKGQGYSGSWGALAYTNTFPDSSSVGALSAGGLGLSVVNFTMTHDCSGSAQNAFTARGCSYQLVQGTTSNAFFGFNPYTFVSGHQYLVRAIVWADRALNTDTSAGEFLINASVPTGAAYPSNITGPYVDTNPREVALTVLANASGSGSIYFEIANAASAVTLHVTDITVADVTGLYGINFINLPYVQTIGTNNAVYSAGGPLPGANQAGRIFSHAAVSHNFLTAINTDGTSTGAQAGFADISGTATTAQIGTGTPAASKYVDGATGAWTTLPASGTGTVTTTGSPATGNIAKFSGATSVTNGDLSGDCTTSGTLATTCGKINGTSFAGLATGILKNTTTTGVPSIAIAADFPTLNQNTSGTASNVSGTPVLPNGTTAATQAPSDNSTKLATTAFVSSPGAISPTTVSASTSMTMGGETITHFPHAVFSCYQSFGLTSGASREQCSWTPDQAITITRMQIQVDSAATAITGCSTFPRIDANNGTNTASVTVSASNQIDSGALSVNFAAGTRIDFKVGVAGVGCTNGGNAWTLNVQYKMQ